MSSQSHKIDISIAAKDLLSGALKAITLSTKSLSSELKSATLALDGLKRTERLARQFRDQGQAVRDLSTKWREAEGKIKTLSQKMREAKEPDEALRKSFNETKARAHDLKVVYGEKIEKLRKLRTALNEARFSTKDFSKSSKELHGQIEKETATISSFTKIAERRQKLNDSRKRASEYAIIGQSMGGFGDRILESALRPGKVAMEMEQAMARVRSRVLGTGAYLPRVPEDPNIKKTMQDKDLKSLEDLAYRLSVKTGVRAPDIALAMTQMGSAGFNFKEITEESLRGVLSLSKVGDISTSESVSLTTGIANAFKLPKTELSRMADMVQYTADVSDAGISDMVDVWKMAGSIAHTAKIGPETVAAAIGALADVQVKGSVAATALKNSFLNLIAADSIGGTPKTKEAMILKKLGIHAIDPKTKEILPFIDVFEQLGKKMAKFPSGIRLKIIEEIFGKEGISGIAELIESSVGGGGLAATLRAREMAIRRESAFTSMRKEMIEDSTLQGALKRLSAAFESLMNTIGRISTPRLTAFVSGLTAAIGKIETITKEHPDLIGNLSTLAIGLGAVLTAIGGIAIPVAAISSLLAAVPMAGVLGTALGIPTLGALGYAGYKGYQGIMGKISGAKSISESSKNINSFQSGFNLNAPVTINVASQANPDEIASHVKGAMSSVLWEVQSRERSRLFDY